MIQSVMIQSVMIQSVMIQLIPYLKFKSNFILAYNV